MPTCPPCREQERRVIFGLMIGQEGKTLIPIYRAYTQAGFDPDKDLLQGYSYGRLPQVAADGRGRGHLGRRPGHRLGPDDQP